MGQAKRVDKLIPEMGFVAIKRRSTIEELKR
jgi:hypothetical protein